MSKDTLSIEMQIRAASLRGRKIRAAEEKRRRARRQGYPSLPGVSDLVRHKHSKFAARPVSPTGSSASAGGQEWPSSPASDGDGSASPSPDFPSRSRRLQQQTNRKEVSDDR
jgi:hypothetical protein